LFCVIAMPIGTPVSIARSPATPTIDTCSHRPLADGGRLAR
jgi:hypothetical protein